MPFREDIQKKILKIIPQEAGISKIDFEGPSVVVYVLNPRLVMEKSECIKQLAKELKKHIIIRGDPKVRLSKTESNRKIREILSRILDEQALDNIYFNDHAGEVYIYLKRPVRERKKLEKTILAETGWKAEIIPTALEMARGLPRDEIEHVRQVDIGMAKERHEFLKNLGYRIHRDPIVRESTIKLEVLGSGFEVGRSALLVKTRESTVLLDCGLKPTTTSDEPPYLDELDLDELDAVIITHAHMDHIGYVPYLYKYGYKGPVYMTEPTKYLMEILLLDYIELCEREGRKPPYSAQDLTSALYHTITLDYDSVTDIAPDIKLTLYDAGHEIGSSIIHLHIGNGLYNIIYTGDFKYGSTRLLNQATRKFRRVELLIMESTYGGKADIQPPRIESEKKLIEAIRETLEDEGKVLIPVFSTGRAQEILLVLNESLMRKEIPKVPIYVDGMILETLNVHLMFPDYLNKSIREQIYDGINPFLNEYVKPIERPKRPEKRHEQVMSIVQGEPCIILAPHGMLNGGPILDYFVHMAENEKNSIIFVSYQAEGTLGRKLVQGDRKVSLRYYNEELTLNVKMKVIDIPGFSGHSDRKQLLNYIRDIDPKPQKIVLVHGESSKIVNLALTIELKYKIPVITPNNLEAIRLV